MGNERYLDKVGIKEKQWEKWKMSLFIMYKLFNSRHIKQNEKIKLEKNICHKWNIFFYTNEILNIHY